MTTFGSVRPGGDPKFSFSSCQKEGLGCTRDTALRRLRDLAWMRWDDAVCWEEGGAGRWLASPCIQLQPCLLHDGRGGSMAPYCCSRSPHCPMLLPRPCSGLATWLSQKSVGRSSPKHFPCTSAAPPAHSWPRGTEAGGWPPSAAAWTPRLKAADFKGDRDRRSSLSSSDPFPHNKYPQSSFCIGACITELAHLPLLCQRQHPSGPAPPLQGAVGFGGRFHVPSNKHSLSFPR